MVYFESSSADQGVNNLRNISTFLKFLSEFNTFLLLIYETKTTRFSKEFEPFYRMNVPLFLNELSNYKVFFSKLSI